MRSLARDFSSSRRAPPNAASNPPSARASSSARVFSRPQHFCVPSRNGFAPSSIACRLVWTISRAPISAHEIVAELDHFTELVGGIDVQQRERDLAGVEGLLGQPDHHGRILADGIQHHRAGKFRNHLAQNVDALGFQGAEMR